MPKVKVPWLCSRSQPGIKVIIRDLRGHLLHTVTFLVVDMICATKVQRHTLVIPYVLYYKVCNSGRTPSDRPWSPHNLCKSMEHFTHHIKCACK